MADLLTADGLARFGAVAADHVGDDRVPGLVALVARGDQVHVETRGSLSVGARAAGVPLGEVLRTRIFDPLGMRDSALWTTDIDRRAASYQPDRRRAAGVGRAGRRLEPAAGLR